MHLSPVGLGILLVASKNALPRRTPVWPLVAFTATTCHLLVIGVQFRLATHRGLDPDAPPGPDGCGVAAD